MEYIPGESERSAVKALASAENVKKALAFIRGDHERRVREQVAITLIPSPTFHEEKRAEYLAGQFRELGLEDIHTDAAGNVMGLRCGRTGGKAVLIEGHMDTVYPFETPLKPVFDGEYIHCPGINDDASGLAGMLAVLRGLNAADIRTERDVIFMGSAREEGIGGFGGVKAFFAENGGNIAAGIHLDGAGAAAITYQSTGFRTIEVTFRGIGGHAYNDFGEIANPLHAAARAVAKIADLKVPDEPRTTFCVSNFHAGSDAAVHAIASQAVIKINYRSNSQKELDGLGGKILACIEAGCAEETARWGKTRSRTTWRPTATSAPARRTAIRPWSRRPGALRRRSETSRL